MLILAGVSISAIVGDDGVLSKAQYASFINEMAAVEEAVQLWKTSETIEAKGKETNAIPTNGMCQGSDLDSTERLKGEIGYYRVWSLTETQPTTNILSSTSNFNSAFESELIFYPAGVQDLYYLNNDALDIKGNKTYLIDAATGMIYSKSGIALKGVRCYSLSMAKAVMSGESTAPQFAEAEVSGGGASEGQALAGNNEPEFILNPDGSYQLDAEGNKIKNPNYNPNGFKIISSRDGENIYKLYNNGDLYGKGIKGRGLNTSPEIMSAINAYKYTELTFPGNILGRDTDFDYKTAMDNNLKIITGNNRIFVIDSNNELWGWGDNSNNEFGLSLEEIKEYTGREAIKLNVDGKKVAKVFSTAYQTFVLTLDEVPELYAAGANVGRSLGCCGVGNSNSYYGFKKVMGIDNPDKISKIGLSYGNSYATVILTTDGKIYYSGYGGAILGNETPAVNSFTRFFTQLDSNGEELSKNIADFVLVRGIIFLKKDGTLWSSCYDTYMYNTEVGYGFKQFPTTYASNIKQLYNIGSHAIMIERQNGELWVWSKYNKGIGNEIASLNVNADKFFCINSALATDLINDGIKKIVPIYDIGVYYICNNGKIFYDGSMSMDGNPENNNNSKVDKMQDLAVTSSTMSDLRISDVYYNISCNSYIPIIICDNKCYSIYYQSLIFRDNILEKNWVKINNDDVKVKKFIAGNENGANCFLDTNNNLWLVSSGPEMQGCVGCFGNTIDNYVIHPSAKLKNSGNKIIDFCLVDGHCLIVLMDNGDLYATGYGNAFGNGLTSSSISDFALIKKNVTKIFSPENFMLWCISENKLYFSGWNFYGVAPGNDFSYSGNKSIYGLQLADLPDGIDGSMVKDVGVGINVTSHLLTYNETDGYRAFLCGSNSDTGGYPGVNGLGVSSCGIWTEIDYDNKTNKEKIIYMRNYGQIGGYLISENNKLYGWGEKRYLGLGDNSAENTITITDLGLDNVSAVTVGPSWIIATKKDGSVWGTGSNIYGILGRWNGIGRGESNSRYKTALNWVECPELEI